jgi:DNA-binding MarR family transcriptional regulator
MKKISSLDDHLGYWLRCLSNFVSDSFAKRLEKHDITVAQWVVMRSLYGKGDLSLNEAARIVGIDASSLSRMAERMVHKGLINRNTDPIDRRAVKLSLTRKGAQLLPQLADEADANDAAFFSSLSATDKARLLTTIQSLLTANGWNPDTRGKDRMV